MLTEVSRHMMDAAERLAGVLSPDQEIRAAATRAVHDSDRAAEAAAHAVLRGLAATFVTPFDRADVFRLAWSMRRVAARIDAVADTVDVLLVDELPMGVAELLQLLVRTTEVTAGAVPLLNQPRSIAARWIDLTVLIKQAGKLHRRLLLEITTSNRDHTELVRQLEVVSSLRRAVDAVESVADVLETILVNEI